MTIRDERVGDSGTVVNLQNLSGRREKKITRASMANQQSQDAQQNQQHGENAQSSLAGGAVPMEDFYMPPSDDGQKPATR
jgi:hypothetical protein